MRIRVERVNSRYGEAAGALVGQYLEVTPLEGSQQTAVCWHTWPTGARCLCFFMCLDDGWGLDWSLRQDLVPDLRDAVTTLLITDQLER